MVVSTGFVPVIETLIRYFIVRRRLRSALLAIPMPEDSWQNYHHLGGFLLKIGRLEKLLLGYAWQLKDKKMGR